MKHFFLSATCLVCFAVYGRTQQSNSPVDTIRIVLDNDKVRVTEYVSTPGKDVCGKGQHTHAPHLTVFLTDAIVKLTTADGKTQDHNLKAGTTIWSEADTHIAINKGDKVAKVQLVEIKQ